MPDFKKPPWSDVIAFLRGDGIFLVQVVAIVVVMILAMRGARIFVHGVVKALMDREVSEGTAQELSAVELTKRMGTLDDLGVNVIRAFIFLIGMITLLGSFSINIGPAVAGLGIAGVAIGFGAQHLVKDYLNGALILIENQFSKGDIVRIATVAGTVEDFSLRRTTLRDLDGNVHTVPNGEIGVATNLTRIWARVNEDVTVAYGTDIDRASQIVLEVGQSMMEDPVWKRRILEVPHVERVNGLLDSGVALKIMATVRAPERWAVAGELRKRLLVAFAANDIEIPFPHRVILNRPGEAADAASAEEAAAD
ncbi:MAG: mechanosensitive ion channel family protein [Chloroflexota bacterium]